jgi:hypothetical protein
VLDGILSPVTYSHDDWLLQDPGLSIFKSLMDTTGIGNAGSHYRSTLLVEPDSVYHKCNIFSVEDLIAEISPSYTNYTSESNPLYYYAAYHMLYGTWFLNDFVDNYVAYYSTLAGEPILIEWTGMKILINPGAAILDTIIHDVDTTLIDYVGFLYDESNVVTRNGAVHFINWILTTDLPPEVPPEDTTMQSQVFQFYEAPIIRNYEREGGEYLIEDSSLVDVMTWSGSDLYYIKSNRQECRARNEDFLLLDGVFNISYALPEIDTGQYVMHVGAEAHSEANAQVEVSFDGNQLGGIIDLRTGGTQEEPFIQVELGVVSIREMKDHVVEIETAVPGRFLWDFVLFEPI